MSILVLTSDTLIGTPATGNLEYNGQFFGTDSNASRAQLQRIVQGTAVASTSGTSIDFTSLPAWVKRITVMFSALSTNGTSFKQIQLIYGGSTVVNTGYRSSSVRINSTGVNETDATTGFLLNGNSASDDMYGSYVFTNLTGNTWTGFGSTTYEIGLVNSAGGITIAGTLTGVRITTVNGTDTFDAGSINILYE